MEDVEVKVMLAVGVAAITAAALAISAMRGAPMTGAVFVLP